MFERFTEGAGETVVLAQDEAAGFGHNYVGTEHLLLGLLREEQDTAAQVLASVAVTPEEVREQIEFIVGRGDEVPAGEDWVRQAPFTPISKKVLELALRESARLGHNYIGTEHLLLGLTEESEGVAARVLSNLDVDPGEVRREVIERLGPVPGPSRSGEVEAEVEERMGPEELANRVSFRGRGSLRVRVRVGGGPQSVVVELDYAYSVADTDEPLEALDHGELLRRIAESFDDGTYGSIETAVLAAGRLVLDEFPTVDEIEIGVTLERLSEAREPSGITVSRMFSR